MSMTLDQIYIANPITSNNSTDLMYFSQSPYTAGNDAGMTYANFAAQFAMPTQIQQSAFSFHAATGVNDAFVVNLSPAVLSYTDGLIVAMDAATLHNLTTTPTLAVNALAAKSIVTYWGNPAVGDIAAHGTYLFVYNATADNFELINPTISTANTTFVQYNTYNTATDAGTANIYSGTLTPHITTLLNSLQVNLLIANANTGASTLNVNGTPTAIVLSNGNALIGGELVPGQNAMFIYSGTYNAFILLNPANTSATNINAGISYTGTWLGLSTFVLWNSSFYNALANTYTPTISAQYDGGNQASITTLNLGTIGNLNASFTPGMVALTSFTANSLVNIEGSFTPTWGALTTLSMPNLVNVINFSPILAIITSISLNSLQSISAIFGMSAGSLTTLNMTSLSIIGTNFTLSVSSLTSLSLNALITIGGNFQPTANSLTTLNMTSLTTIGGNFAPAIGAMTSLSLNAVTTITGIIEPTAASLTTLNMTGLVSAGGLTWTTSVLTSLNMPALTTMNGAVTLSASSLNTLFNWTSLATCSSTLSITAGSLTTLNLQSLVSTGGTFTLVCGSASTINLTSLNSVVGNIAWTLNTLVTISLPAFQAVTGTLTISSAANLANFTINSGLLRVGGNVTITGAALSQTSVDNILIALANLNGSGGTTSYNNFTINLSGGTSSTPGATGLTAKTTLVGRGCTVTTN